MVNQRQAIQGPEVETTTDEIPILELDPKILPKPTREELARLFECIETEDWIAGSRDVARYVFAVAHQNDPHLQEISASLGQLQKDLAEIVTQEWHLLATEVDADLDRCLAGWPMSFVRWSIALLGDGSNDHLEWKPEVLLHLVRGRRARGDGDDERLQMIEEGAEMLVERAAKGLEDERQTIAWQRELATHFERRHAQRQ